MTLMQSRPVLSGLPFIGPSWEQGVRNCLCHRDELRTQITEEIKKIDTGMLKNVFSYFIERRQACIPADDCHFQQHLYCFRVNIRFQVFLYNFLYCCRVSELRLF